MQTTLTPGAATFRLLTAIAACIGGVGVAWAQEPPSLDGAISTAATEVWSGGDPAAAVALPTPGGEYLAPIADPEGVAFGLSHAGEPCEPCNGESSAGGVRGFYNRCGCETPMFPYFTGPGNCDNWCVGPHWNVEVDGMFIRRDDAEWADVPGAVVIDEFDYGPGVRIFATGYNHSNYGLQIGYEGVNDFHSTAVAGGDEIAYQSTLNSLEINLLRRTAVPLKVFAGFRYVEIDEDFVDTTLATGDSDGFLIENRLIGFQVGGLRDAWQLNRWLTIEPFANAGVYLNDFKRETVDVTGGVVTFDENEFSEIAYLGEAGVTSVLRINACLALRGGYQVMAFDGVGTALDASLAPGLDRDTLIYHGARFGVEYQR